LDNLRSEVWPLFSKPVFVADIEMSNDETNNLLEHCNSQSYHQSQQEGGQENGCELSINKDVLGELDWMNKKIEDKFKQFSDEVMHYENNLSVVNSWYTKTHMNEDTLYHHHSNYMWSGTFYFGNDDKYEQRISFRDFNPGPFHVPNTKENIYNSNGWSFSLKNNMVIFFPSEMNHMVVKNKYDTIRKSLAFNMLPLGDIIIGGVKVKLHEKDKR
tara:strand:+ start:303 stop:947 length:645 start_codon:yes stop_codon:yes gene_type:complete